MLVVVSLVTGKRSGVMCVVQRSVVGDEGPWTPSAEVRN
jgi:hypothetical protein